MRTRVKRERRNKDRWEWRIFDGDLSDSKSGFDSEAEARAALAEALVERNKFAQTYEDSQRFVNDTLT